MTRRELWTRREELADQLQLTHHARRRAFERRIELSSIRLVLKYGRWTPRQGTILVHIGADVAAPGGRPADEWNAARDVCVVVGHCGQIPTVWRWSER